MIKTYTSFLLALFILTSGIASGMKNPAYLAPAGSREIKYPVSSIPADLKKNADRIVREYTMNIEVRSLNTLVINVSRVVTVLRENGLEDDFLEVYYDQNCKVNSVHAAIYNSEGIETDHSESSDIIDESAIPDGSFYTDDRVKRLRLAGMIYPFTLEIRYEIVMHKLLGYPIWHPQDDYRVSVEQATLALTAEDGLLPRFREVNITSPAVVEKHKEATTVTYTLSNIQAVEREIYSIPFEERIPLIYIAPNDYRTLGQDYDFRTWKSYGQWCYSLIQDRDQLPESSRQQLMDRIHSKSDKLEKIREIYSYLQQNTRYLNVKIGIGGWQPAEAGAVAKKGYGDCKGLVNYAKALLSAAGIPSYYTIVNAGSDVNDIFPDFPFNQFNHVILAVPLENDTVWLECTSQSQPFGFLGSFTANRHALLVTPQGGILVRTPACPGSANTMNRKTRIDLDTNGNASMLVTSVYRGLQYEVVEGRENKSRQDLEKLIFKQVRAASATVKKIEYRYKKDLHPEADETLELFVRSFASQTGSRIFLPFYPFGGMNLSLNELLSRKTPLFIRSSFIDNDSVEVQVPPGYQVETLPAETSTSSKFGEFRMKTIQQGDKLIYVRTLEMKEGRYAPESFTDFTTFLQSIARADKSNAILKRK